MKKFISVVLACNLLMSAVPGALADEAVVLAAVDVERVSPDPAVRNNYIAPNQGKIEIVFSDVIDENTLDKVTFKSAEGEPVGGIFKTLSEDNKSILVEFGELKENTEYKLYIDEGKTYTYKTIEKDLVEEGFDDWEASDAVIVNGAFVGNSDLKAVSPSADMSVKEEEGGRYLEIKSNSVKSDTAVGAVLPYEMTDAKIVQNIKIKNNDASGDELRVGAFSEYNVSAFRYNGETMDKVFENFVKDENGYYNNITVVDFYDVPNYISGSTTYKTKYQVTISDMNSDAVWQSKVGGLTCEKIHSAAAFKSYPNTDEVANNIISLTYYRAGLYTLPEILGTPVGTDENREVSFTVNTDLNKDTLGGIKVLDEAGKEYASNVSYDENTRNVTVDITDKIYDGYNYIVKIDGVVSLDGYEMNEEFTFTHKNTEDIVISPEIDGSYSYNEKEQIISFNTNVELDENSLDTVTFTDLRNGKTMDIDVTYEDKKVTVKINGRMYNTCKYELNLKGVKSTDGFNMKDNITITHNDESDVFDFISVENVIPNPKMRESVKNGTPTYVANAEYIAPNQGYVSIVFDKTPLSDEENLEKITFTDALGNPPKGRMIKSIEGNTLTLEFGELTPNTTYTLNIPEDFESADGLIFEETQKIEYKVLDKIFIEEDFEDLAVESKTTTNKFEPVGENGIQVSTSGGNTAINIKLAESGNKYLEVIGNTKAKDMFICWFPKAIYENIFIEGSFATIMEYANVQGGSSYPGDLGRFQHWETAEASTASISSTNIDKFTKDDDGFSRIQMRSTKKNTREANPDIDNGSLSYYADFETMAIDLLGYNKSSNTLNITTASSNYGRVQTYSFAKLYINADDDVGKNGFKMAYVKSGLFTVPDMIGEPEYNIPEKTITYYINTDLDDTTLSGVSLKNEKSGEEVQASFSYDFENRALIAELSSELSYQTNYTLDLTGVKSTDGFIFEEAKSFKNILNISDVVEDIKVSNDFLNAKVEVTFAAPVTGSAADVTLFDENGNTVDTEASFNANILTLSFKNSFDYNMNYKLVIGKDIKYSVLPELKFESDMQYSFKLLNILDVTGVSAVKNGDTITVSAKVSNYMNNAQGAVITTAAYDDKGHMIAADFELANINELDTADVNNTLVNAGKAVSVKIFVLSQSPELKTLYKAVEVKLN